MEYRTIASINLESTYISRSYVFSSSPLHAGLAVVLNEV
jgi:hypothetical protein